MEPIPNTMPSSGGTPSLLLMLKAFLFLGVHFLVGAPSLFLPIVQGVVGSNNFNILAKTRYNMTTNESPHSRAARNR